MEFKLSLTVESNDRGQKLIFNSWLASLTDG